MAGAKRNSPRKGGSVESPSAAGKLPNVTAGGMSPTLVLDPSFSSSAAVTNTAATAATGSESAPAEASDEFVGGDHRGDTQSTPLGCADGSDGSENEGGRGDSVAANDANDEDDGDGGGVDRFKNWTIEGVEDLNEEENRHMNAFYVLLKKWFGGKEYTTGILTKADYDARVELLWSIKKGDTDCCESFKSGNFNAYKWAKKYHLFTVGVETSVLVLRPDPKGSGAVDVMAMALSHL